MATTKKAIPQKIKPVNKITTQKTTTQKTNTPKAVQRKAAISSTAKSNTAKEKMPNAIFNIDEINQLLKAVNHSNVNELKLEKGDFKITIRQGMPETQSAPTQIMQQMPSIAPTPSVATPPIAPIQAVETVADNLITIKSPMIGTFYRSAGPEKPTFVNVGDDIKVGQVLCIVEAMKLFNEIESEVNGKIVKVLADDSSPVEYDQPLFLVQPS